MVSLFEVASQISPIITITVLCLIAAIFVSQKRIRYWVDGIFIQTSYFFISSSISYLIYLSFPGTFWSSVCELLGLIFFWVGVAFLVFVAYKIRDFV
jgi:hypothetical protein